MWPAGDQDVSSLLLKYVISRGSKHTCHGLELYDTIISNSSEWYYRRLTVKQLVVVVVPLRPGELG